MKFSLWEMTWWQMSGCRRAIIMCLNHASIGIVLIGKCVVDKNTCRRLVEVDMIIACGKSDESLKQRETSLEALVSG